MGIRVYVGGTFDALHRGHIELLRFGSRIGDLTVALNRDEFVHRYKGFHPVNDLAERAAQIEALEIPGLKVIQNWGDASSRKTMEGLGTRLPNVILAGDDWAGKDYLKQLGIDEAWLTRHKVNIVYFRRIGGLSSSRLVDYEGRTNR
jgi:cytidyltransferase-like protein